MRVAGILRDGLIESVVRSGIWVREGIYVQPRCNEARTRVIGSLVPLVTMCLLVGYRKRQSGR